MSKLLAMAVDALNAQERWADADELLEISRNGGKPRYVNVLGVDVDLENPTPEGKAALIKFLTPRPHK